MEAWIKQKPWRLFITIFAIGFITGIVLDLTLMQPTQYEPFSLVLRNIFTPFFLATISTMLIFKKDK